MPNETIQHTESSISESEPGPKARRYDVDWLRVIGIGTVFLFHCGKFFDDDYWHVKNAELSPVAGMVIGAVAQWLMPLFFVLSGIGTYCSLKQQSLGGFVIARTKRLLVPLVFGTFVIIAPLQVYLERLSHGQFRGSFWAFYPHYFEGWYGYGGNFAWMGLHLWYLEMLFLFSVILMPLFVWLSKESSRPWMARLGRLCSKPGAVFLPAIVVLVMEGITRSGLVRNTVLGWRAFGSWPLPQHLVFFLLGYLAAAIPRLHGAIERHRKVALATHISVIAFASWLIFAKGFSGDGVFFAMLRSINVIACLVAILGYASKYLRFENKFLRSANEAVLPFYVLHQTVIVTIGFFLVRWNTAIPTKFLLIVVISFALTVAIYELAVKRMNLLRFLFGMKLRASTFQTYTPS